jgi:hypothetical protein
MQTIESVLGAMEINSSTNTQKVLEALGQIWENPVGKFLLRALASISIMYNGSSCRDFRVKQFKITEDSTSPLKFNLGTNTLNIGIKSEGDELIGIDALGNIVIKRSTFAEDLFHELSHALHYYLEIGQEDLNQNPTLDRYFNYIYNTDFAQTLRSRWGGIGYREGEYGDEEFHNITGHVIREGVLRFNPINCNMFDAFESVKRGTPIICRFTHRVYNDGMLKDELRHEGGESVNLGLEITREVNGRIWEYFPFDC